MRGSYCFLVISLYSSAYAYCIHFSRTYLPVCRFQVKKKQFFHNFLTIMLFGVVGVFISALIITAGIRQISSELILNSTLQHCPYIIIGILWQILIHVKWFFMHWLGSQWLFPRMGFHGLSARDYVGEI